MFGFSLAELIVVCLVALFFIKPKDLPDIARAIGRIFFRGKKLLNEVKKQFREMESELGIDELKQEMNRGIAEEKMKVEEKNTTVIVDIYGNEHHVANIDEIRADMSLEERDAEIKKMNEINLKKTIS
jgi:Sec-independent protein translocase protein TatA